MPEYGVTSNGFVLKRFDAILEEVQSDVSEALHVLKSARQEDGIGKSGYGVLPSIVPKVSFIE